MTDPVPSKGGDTGLDLPAGVIQCPDCEGIGQHNAVCSHVTWQEQPPSKDVVSELRRDVLRDYQDERQLKHDSAGEIEDLRRENVRWENAHKILLAEIERLKKQLASFVKANSELAMSMTHEPGALRRAAEPHTCECSACYEMRAIINGTAQPPGDGQ